MQIALPELDGRIDGPPISFRKEAPPGFPTRREAFPEGVAQAVSMAEGWIRLAATPPAQRQLALILSDYPGAEGQMTHAVGLDGFASIASILQLLVESGYDTFPNDPVAIAGQITQTQPIPILSAAEYRRLFITLPQEVREAVTALWGTPDRAISARFHLYGKVCVAVQPRRSQARDHKAHYHDPDAMPGHEYLGFHLWMHHVQAPHAMIHLGAHGTMEWLPGKAVALSRASLPQALCRGLPVIYPFIVNNPRDAAAAKRRLGAVTIGHMTPMRKAGHDHHLAALERLIDEYAEAEGMDRRRGKNLRRDIILKAQSCGLWDECRLSETQLNEDEALAQIGAAYLVASGWAYKDEGAEAGSRGLSGTIKAIGTHPACAGPRRD
ncbi:MAG: cobaltochelatase subunit CobN [Acetobacteraceae bacterium]